MGTAVNFICVSRAACEYKYPSADPIIWSSVKWHG